MLLGGWGPQGPMVIMPTNANTTTAAATTIQGVSELARAVCPSSYPQWLQNREPLCSCELQLGHVALWREVPQCRQKLPVAG
jgi:hypothetical protein